MSTDPFPVGRLLSHLSACDDVSLVEADGDARGLVDAELSRLGHSETGTEGSERGDECTGQSRSTSAQRCRVCTGLLVSRETTAGSRGLDVMYERWFAFAQ